MRADPRCSSTTSSAPSPVTAFSGATNSAERLALTLGLPAPSHPLDVVRAYRDRMKTHKPIPPVTVDRGPVLENIHRDDEVDVTSLVAPFLHEKDGGRYIGTDDLVIMRDPDSGWVNLGTYRSQVHGPDRVGLWISPGKQGRRIREKYFARGEPCPVLIYCGLRERKALNMACGIPPEYLPEAHERDFSRPGPFAIL
ncbi:UbiD family decarboxylase domain-containing protein [Actinomadura sp. SCN-SB]|uniref:UbiD family decarboxylase domain-containing protein n=1 Tax=Actinomadura sp. SCN-SB TaxID=3373092 RepID=UPI0037534E2B